MYSGLSQSTFDNCPKFRIQTEVGFRLKDCHNQRKSAFHSFSFLPELKADRVNTYKP